MPRRRAARPAPAHAGAGASAAPTPPAGSPWLFRPSIDLAVGAGLWTLPLLALTAWATSAQLVPMAFAFYALSVLCNNPHYFATVHRAYATAADRAKYRLFTLHATAVLAAVAVAAHWAPVLLPVLFTAYVAWSPWHYTGQNFGVALLFARRAGPLASPTRHERALLLAAFAATYGVWLLAAFQRSADGGPYLLSPMVPDEWSRPARAGLMAMAAASAGAAFLPMVRRAGWRPLFAPLATASTQALWFCAPSALELFAPDRFRQQPVYYATGALAFMHCAQYLWVTGYFAQRRAGGAGVPPGVRSSGVPPEADGSGAMGAPTAKGLASATIAKAGLPPSASGGTPELHPAGATPAPRRPAFSLARYYALMTLGGLALFVPAPWLVSRALGRDFVESFLICTAVVNLHHFILDGAIWKLRDGPLARLLLGAKAEGAGTAAGAAGAGAADGGPSPTDAAPRPAPAVRRALLAVGAAALVALAAVDLAQSWATREGAGPAALAWAARLNPFDTRVALRRARALAAEGRGDEALAAARRAVALNPRSADARFTLGALLVGAGRLDEARAHYRAQEALGFRPDLTTWLNTGVLAAQDGRTSDAVARLTRAAELAPERADAQLNLAEALSAAGDWQGALVRYGRWVELQRAAGAGAGPPGAAPPDRARLAQVALRIAEAYRSLGDGAAAREAEANAAALAVP